MERQHFQRFNDAATLEKNLRGGVVAIGNFDGVHRGHLSVLQTALDLAKEKQCPALALTFEPHPRTVFQPQKPVFRLTPASLRAKVLEQLGYDGVIEQEFNAAFANLSADDFVETILVKALGLCHVVTGYDFHFGHKRQGNPQFLSDKGKQCGFGVTLVDAYIDENNEVISSSKIRNLLHEGDVVGAAGLLNYRYNVQEKIIEGQQLGRTLGFPTANMALPKQTNLKYGIYGVRFIRENGDVFDGVASYGKRPTVVNDGQPLLETYLFDFDGDLYGQTCRVSFFGFLRGEEKFDDLDALKTQMLRDEQEARSLLASVSPLSPHDLALNF